MLRSFLLSLLLLSGFQVFSQDTIVLINGRTIPAKSVELKEYSVYYRTLKTNSKLRTVDPLAVFSIKYKDGTERIIYTPDTLDPLDFKVEEMRSFIKGEQDARKFYRNTPVKLIGFAAGFGSSYLGFYGLAGPPLVATVIGSFSPNVDKQLTFKVKGSVASNLGIAEGSYFNAVTGSNPPSIIPAGTRLKLGKGMVKFNDDSPADSIVAAINKVSATTAVNATMSDGKIMLYRSDNFDLVKGNNPYREGFEKRARDYKIRNTLLGSLAGFVAGVLTFSYLL